MGPKLVFRKSYIAAKIFQSASQPDGLTIRVRIILQYNWSQISELFVLDPAKVMSEDEQIAKEEL